MGILSVLPHKIGLEHENMYFISVFLFFEMKSSFLKAKKPRKQIPLVQAAQDPSTQA